MTGPVDSPPWRALEIGPGGVPPETVRPLGGPAAGGYGPVPSSNGPRSDQLIPQQQTRALADLPPAWQQWTAAAAAPESKRRGLRSPAGRIVAGVLALAVLIGLALWGNSVRPLGGSRAGQVAVGDCLASTGRQIDGTVSCSDASADFQVVGRYPDTSDAGECSASPADLAVVQLGPTLLCLNYVAVPGDCLLLGRGSGQVGKVDCGSGSTGEYRVRAVLKNSIDAHDCPAGTTQTLVHRYNSEVVCLSRP